MFLARFEPRPSIVTCVSYHQTSGARLEIFCTQLYLIHIGQFVRFRLLFSKPKTKTEYFNFHLCKLKPTCTETTSKFWTWFRSASTSFFGFSVFCTLLEPAKDPLMVKSVFSLEHKDSEQMNSENIPWVDGSRSLLWRVFSGSNCSVHYHHGRYVGLVERMEQILGNPPHVLE